MVISRGSRRKYLVPLAGCLLLASTLAVGTGPSAASADGTCDIPDQGALTIGDLPEGSNAVDCDAVGRVVSSTEGLQAEIPPPGTTLTVEEIYPDDSIMFAVTLGDAGEISYASDADDSDPAETPSVAPSSPPECDQSAYSTLDRKEYGTYEFWIGDGSFPASMTRTEFQDKVITSANHIVQAHNNCGLDDNVGASGSAEGWSDYESDMSPASCGDGSTDGRDHVSVWDAGNLDGTNGKPSPVARTCAWTFPTAGVKNDLLEADVRFNITDYDFTNSPNDDSCQDKYYDVVSVGTHEAGHIWGLGHVSEADYPWMTMSTNSEICDSTARTLGKGDVRGLESIY